MPTPAIRPARPDEYDGIAQVWLDSFVSTGLAESSEHLLAQLRARIPREMENGWSLYVADDAGRIAAMLALHLPERCLAQLFVAPEYHARASAAGCSPLPAKSCRKKSGCAASAKTKTPGAGTSAKVLRSSGKHSSR